MVDDYNIAESAIVSASGKENYAGSCGMNRSPLAIAKSTAFLS